MILVYILLIIALVFIIIGLIQNHVLDRIINYGKPKKHQSMVRVYNFYDFPHNNYISATEYHYPTIDSEGMFGRKQSNDIYYHIRSASTIYYMIYDYKVICGFHDYKLGYIRLLIDIDPFGFVNKFQFFIIGSSTAYTFKDVRKNEFSHYSLSLKKYDYKLFDLLMRIKNTAYTNKNTELEP